MTWRRELIFTCNATHPNAYHKATGFPAPCDYFQTQDALHKWRPETRPQVLWLTGWLNLWGNLPR